MSARILSPSQWTFTRRLFSSHFLLLLFFCANCPLLPANLRASSSSFLWSFQRLSCPCPTSFPPSHLPTTPPPPPLRLKELPLGPLRSASGPVSCCQLGEGGVGGGRGRWAASRLLGTPLGEGGGGDCIGSLLIGGRWDAVQAVNLKCQNGEFFSSRKDAFGDVLPRRVGPRAFCFCCISISFIPRCPLVNT